MDVQPDAGEGAGPSEPFCTSTGSNTPQGTSAPRVRTNSDIWSLITGPEAGTWSRLLVQDHLASGDRLALFLTCKAARDMVLVTADDAIVIVPAKQGGEPFSLASLHAIRCALQTRGNLPTWLKLYFPDAHQLSLALGVLEAGTTWLDELTIGVLGNGERLPADVLTTAGRCCRNLRTLNIANIAEMADPEVFPTLQQLYIYITDDLGVLGSIFRTAAPYLSQLTKLTLCTADWSQPTPRPPPALLPLLLTPGIIATHLRNLHIPGTLGDTLVGMLLQSAPALEDLTVCIVRLETDMHAQVQVPWRVLTTNTLHLSSLARLPAAPEMKVMVDGGEDEPPTLVCDTISIGEAVAARLKGADPRCGGTVAIVPGEEIAVADHGTALHVGLGVMRRWSHLDRPTDLQIALHEWTMCRDVMLQLRQPPSFVKRLALAGNLVWLEQVDLYNTLLGLLPDHIRWVTIQWWPHMGALTNAQVHAICLGAPANRTPDTILGFALVGFEAGLSQAVRLRMQQGIYPNVTLYVLD